MAEEKTFTKHDANENKASISIESELRTDVKVGDHLFTAEFTSTNGKSSFNIKEFEVKAVRNLLKDKKNYFEIVDVRFPKATIKSDLETGYFRTAKDAAKAFLNMIEYIYTDCKKAYERDFNV